MSTQLLLQSAAIGACATLIFAIYVTAFRFPKALNSEWEPSRCPTCGGESFETEYWGHAEIGDFSDEWFWYLTCQACQGHCARRNGRFYAPSTSEWDDYVTRPFAESELQQAAEDAVKEQEYRKYKWCFDKDWPFDTENRSSETTE